MKRMAMVLTTLLLALAFAGCVDEDPTPDPATTDAVDGPGTVPDEGLNADSVVDAPEWEVGDYFGHHIYFGSQDLEGTHIDAVVVDAGGDYTLKPNDPDAAKWEAVWDFPMLGSIGKDLTTTAFTADWNIYDFPLSDGKEWAATFNPLFAGARELSMTATFDEKIKTPQGTKPGFRIEGINANGEVELLTDYIPEIGWYGELTYYDRLFTPNTDEFVIQVFAMGQGAEWDGTVYTVDAVSKIGGNSPCFAPVNADGSVNDQCVSTPESTSFDISADADQLYGIALVGALAGQSRIDLVDPTPFDHDFVVQSTGLDDFQLLFEFVEMDEPAPGTWNYAWSGAGLVTFGFTQLWEIQANEEEFAP